MGDITASIAIAAALAILPGLFASFVIEKYMSKRDSQMMFGSWFAACMLLIVSALAWAVLSHVRIEWLP